LFRVVMVMHGRRGARPRGQSITNRSILDIERDLGGLDRRAGLDARAAISARAGPVVEIDTGAIRASIAHAVDANDAVAVVVVAVVVVVVEEAVVVVEVVEVIVVPGVFQRGLDALAAIRALADVVVQNETGAIRASIALVVGASDTSAVVVGVVVGVVGVVVPGVFQRGLDARAAISARAGPVVVEIDTGVIRASIALVVDANDAVVAGVVDAVVVAVVAVAVDEVIEVIGGLDGIPGVFQRGLDALAADRAHADVVVNADNAIGTRVALVLRKPSIGAGRVVEAGIVHNAIDQVINVIGRGKTGDPSWREERKGERGYAASEQ